MATENKPNVNNSKKRKQRYLPHNKQVKKGAYPLRPGVQGFFITCDGGRERQASQEAINVIDSFFEELVYRKDQDIQQETLSNKPLNKKIKFSYSDSSSNEDDNEDDDQEHNENVQKEEDIGKPSTERAKETTHENSTNEETNSQDHNSACSENQRKENKDSNNNEGKNSANKEVEAEEPAVKKPCLEKNASACGKVISNKVEEKSVDKLIEAELAELADRSKRRFSKLDSGCNGVVFIQMRKRDGDPSPKDIVQYMMTSVSSTKKHLSRFMLRVLPVEVTCYASEEEIAKAIAPLIAQYFPVESEATHKFSVLYDARANTGIDRMKIIDTVAKSVPGPHKVDLGSPDMNIVVQIVKTVCLIGVVEKYKELAKYNLRQLTSSKP